LWRKEFASETPSMAHPLPRRQLRRLPLLTTRVSLRRHHRLRQPMRHDIAA
jgi:hypothetical protein